MSSAGSSKNVIKITPKMAECLGFPPVKSEQAGFYDTKGEPHMPRTKSALAPLDLSGAQLTLVGPGAMEERRPTRGTRERTKAQKTLDALVEKAHAKWVASGRPEKFWESPGGHARVPEGQLVQVQRAIHRSGAFLDMKIRFGTIEIEDGYADVVFSVSDRSVKPES